MSGTGTTGLLLIIANVIFSYRGFNSEIFFDRYKFEVDKILINKDYKRFISSGFLHVGWMHLIFNMLSLYAFSGIIVGSLGSLNFLVIYFASLIGGGLLSLLIHKNHGDYSAVGASGAICGIIFASIALFPGIGIGFFGLPFSIPNWLFGILFVAFSIYGIRSGKDNIGHESHLGGALIGMAVALLLEPAAFLENYIVILIIAVPAIAFIYLIGTRPETLLVDNLFYKNHRDNYTIDQQYNLDKNLRQQEIDQILEKISKKGIKSLSRSEKEKLKRYSETGR
jgi:membrane associated rhomboid family serine protease